MDHFPKKSNVWWLFSNLSSIGLKLTHFFSKTLKSGRHTEYSDLANEIDAHILYNRLVAKILKSIVGKNIKNSTDRKLTRRNRTEGIIRNLA